jgi:hypothetical protein
MPRTVHQLQIGDDPRLEVDVWDDGSLRIDCTSDWCGDTESGFGATVGVNLNERQARDLLTFLAAHLNQNT